MSVVISGALIDGAGIPMSGCHIILKSRVNTSEVVMRTVADVVTGNCGDYCFKAQTGKYCVYLRQDWHDEYCVGDIAVYDDSKPGTLNDFLTALDEGDLKPDVVKRFEEMVAQAQQSAKAAAESERQAGHHAADAQKIKEGCQTLADNVRQNAETVAEDKKQVVQLALQVEETAEEVRQDAEAAKQAASDAEQAREDIDVALSATLKTANHLSEIAAEGAEAQQRSRDNLGLKGAATMEAQSDIYDRAEGRLPIPGAFGFGHIFIPGEVIRFNSKNEFLMWVKKATPGEYSVNGSSDVLPGVVFQGMISIRWLEAIRNPPNPAYTVKGIIFYGVNGDIYFNRYWSTGDGWLTDWINLKVNEASLRALIETRAPLNSPAFTGTPTTPTPPDDAAGLETANAAFVRRLLAALVDSSPEALDTLNELAAALGNDPNFATTVTNALAGKQPLNEVLTAISKLTQRADTLPYFNDDEDVSLTPLSEKARTLLAQATAETMRRELELKAAATMAPQSGIRDRSREKLALPGMYGFGHEFSDNEVTTINSYSRLQEWAKNAHPGRYYLYCYNIESTDIFGRFYGIVDVKWTGYPGQNTPPDEVSKVLTFTRDGGATPGVFYIAYGYFYRPEAGGAVWGLGEPVSLVTDGGVLSQLLSATSGGASWFNYKYPQVGVPVLAAYQGETAGARDIRIGLGDVVPGSRLAPVNITGGFSESGAYESTPGVSIAGINTYNFPGRYQALSGTRGSYSANAVIGLFVRIQ